MTAEFPFWSPFHELISPKLWDQSQIEICHQRTVDIPLHPRYISVLSHILLTVIGYSDAGRQTFLALANIIPPLPISEADYVCEHLTLE